MRDSITASRALEPSIVVEALQEFRRHVEAASEVAFSEWGNDWVGELSERRARPKSVRDWVRRVGGSLSEGVEGYHALQLVGSRSSMPATRSVPRPPSACTARARSIRSRGCSRRGQTPVADSTPGGVDVHHVEGVLPVREPNDVLALWLGIHAREVPQVVVDQAASGGASSSSARGLSPGKGAARIGARSMSLNINAVPTALVWSCRSCPGGGATSTRAPVIRRPFASVDPRLYGRSQRVRCCGRQGASAS